MKGSERGKKWSPVAAILAMFIFRVVLVLRQAGQMRQVFVNEEIHYVCCSKTRKERAQFRVCL